jgi:DNA-binding IclR family transcriptional regulator
MGRSTSASTGRGIASRPVRRPAGSGVKSAERAMRVLAVLARYAKPVPTMMLARECDVPKSSMHHLLNSMRANDFVVYYESERAWGLGIAVFELGSAYLRSEPLQRLGRPLLADLSRKTKHTSHLAILHGNDSLYLDKESPIEGGPALVTEVGVRLPAHLTAVGQAILATLPEAQVRAIFGHGELVSRTGVGVDALDTLLANLDEARDRGYAYEESMTSLGICCLAAPVISHEGFGIASIGVTMPVEQATSTSIEVVAELVCQAADRLSVHVGGSSAWLIGRVTPG